MFSAKLYVLFIYLSANLYFSIYFIFDGKLGGDFKGTIDAEPYSVIFAFIITFVVFLFMSVFFYGYFERALKTNKNINSNKFLDFVFVCITIYYFFVSYFYNIGIEGADTSNVPKLLFYINTLIQPSFLIPMYLFCSTSSSIKKLHIFVFVIFLFSSFLTGQTYHLFLFGFYLVLNKYRFNFSFFKIMIITISSLLIYPIIRVAKTVIILLVQGDCSYCDSGFVYAMNGYLGDDLSAYEIYVYFLNRALERFQSISSTAFLLSDNGKDLFALANGNTSGFFKYWLFDIINDLLFNKSIDGLSIQQTLAMYINGNSNWSAQINLAGLLIFYGPLESIYLFIYVLMLMFLSFLALKISRNKNLYPLTWFMFFLLVLHGWLSPYTLYIQSILIYGLIANFCIYIDRAN